MTRAASLAGSLSVALLACGCDGAVAKVREIVGADAPASEDAAEVANAGVVDDAVEATGAAASADAKLLAEAVVELAPELGAAPPEPAKAAVPTAAAQGPDELEVHDVTVEFAEGSGYYGGYGYGGYGSPAKVMKVEAAARTKATPSRKGEVMVRVSCQDGGESFADAAVASIDGGYANAVPGPGAEFKLSAQLFTTNVLGDPTACRVSVTLRDNDRTPHRRGGLELCWSSGRKAAAPCETAAEPTPEVAWSVRDAQFLPTAEFGFVVVAGSGPPPDRLGLRATCHGGDKHFVEFQFLNARWYGLEPGDAMLHRQMLQSTWEFMRSAECDVEVQDVSYDFEKFAVRGVNTIGRRCVRPAGVRDGQCRATVTEVPAVDAKGTPAQLAILNANASSYGRWYSAYAQAEITLAAPVSKDAKLTFASVCGKKREEMPITLVTPLEMVYPGQSVRVQAGVSGEGHRKVASCRTHFALEDVDSSGAKQTWVLGEQCYRADGTTTPCPGTTAPPPSASPAFSGKHGPGRKPFR